MNLKLSVRFGSSASVPPARRQLITWENPIAWKYGYCAKCRPKPNGEPQGQYSHAPVHITDAAGQWVGTYSENTLATRITNQNMRRIAAQQAPDEYTVKSKMNYAMWGGQDTWGSIMRASYANGDDWMNAQDIRMIGAVWAGQWVEVLESKTMLTTLNGIREQSLMWRIKTYQPDEWGLPNAWQKVTSVNADNVHGEKPHGTFWFPIWLGATRLSWVFDRWLEPI